MFVSERRNHSKTVVYDIACVRVLVDTPSAVDKLKKCEKGLKFEWFEGFLPILSIDCADTRCENPHEIGSGWDSRFEWPGEEAQP